MFEREILTTGLLGFGTGARLTENIQHCVKVALKIQTSIVFMNQ